MDTCGLGVVDAVVAHPATPSVDATTNITDLDQILPSSNMPRSEHTRTVAESIVKFKLS